MDTQGLEFAKQEESEDMVDIGIGERDACDGRLAHTLTRMQLRRGFNLYAEVWRGAQ
jgi:hypothetical protein